MLPSPMNPTGWVREHSCSSTIKYVQRALETNLIVGAVAFVGQDTEDWPA